MNLGRVTLYIATSLDGYIASEDGGVSWLDGFESTEGADRYEAFVADVDCLAMGARTYEQVLSFGEWPYGEKQTYVLSHRDLPLASEAVEVVEGNIEELAAEWRRRHGHVWLVGGAAVVESFFVADAIDELRVTVVPLVLGSGIRLFGDGVGRVDLRFVDATPNPTGLVELRYEAVSE